MWIVLTLLPIAAIGLYAFCALIRRLHKYHMSDWEDLGCPFAELLTSSSMTIQKMSKAKATAKKLQWKWFVTTPSFARGDIVARRWLCVFRVALGLWIVGGISWVAMMLLK